jgi:hypothetical protein
MTNGTRRSVRGQRRAPAALYPRKRLGTHCTGGRLGPGSDWIGTENLVPIRIRSPKLPARSQSLYRLRYPAHNRMNAPDEFVAAGGFERISLRCAARKLVFILK